MLLNSRGSKRAVNEKGDRVLRDCIRYFPNETALSYSFPYSITSWNEHLSDNGNLVGEQCEKNKS